MKYKFVLQQIPEQDDNPFVDLMTERVQNIFSAEIDAEEMVELMQVTWHLAERRAKRVVT